MYNKKKKQMWNIRVQLTATIQHQDQNVKKTSFRPFPNHLKLTTHNLH